VREHQPQHVRVPGDFECFPSDRLLTHLLRLVLRTQPRSGTRKTLCKWHVFCWFIDRNELRREIFFAGHLSPWPSAVSHRLQDATTADLT